jgi:hypothetical protein
VIGSSVLELGTMDLLFKEERIISLVLLSFSFDLGAEVNDSVIFTTDWTTSVDGLVVAVLDVVVNVREFRMGTVASDGGDVLRKGLLIN